MSSLRDSPRRLWHNLFCFRMNDAQSVALITADESLRGGKKLRLKDTADAASFVRV